MYVYKHALSFSHSIKDIQSELYVPRLYSCKQKLYNKCIQYVVVVVAVAVAVAVVVAVAVAVVVAVAVAVAVGVVVVVVVVLVPNISMSQCPSQLFTWHGVTAAEIHQVGCTTNGGSFH